MQIAISMLTSRGVPRIFVGGAPINFWAPLRGIWNVGAPFAQGFSQKNYKQCDVVASHRATPAADLKLAGRSPESSAILCHLGAIGDTWGPLKVVSDASKIKGVLRSVGFNDPWELLTPPNTLFSADLDWSPRPLVLPLKEGFYYQKKEFWQARVLLSK